MEQKTIIMSESKDNGVSVKIEPNKPSTSGTSHSRRKGSLNLTLQEKLEAVKKRDAGASTSEIALEYYVSETTVRRWIRQREKLEGNTRSLTSKRVRLSPVEKVNEALAIWFQGVRRKNKMSVIDVKVKAQEFFQRFGGTEVFKASDGWFRTWKQRNGIRLITDTGEQLTANTEAAEEFKTEILELIETEELSLSQVFNADEIGLCFKTMPNKSSIVKTEHSPSGLAKMKDKLTIMTCCNADGSFKVPLLVVGRYQKPRALQNLAPQLLSVKYTNHKYSWMSAIIFERWFKEDFVPRVVTFLKTKGLPEKAILLLDNTKGYPSANALVVGEIRAIFFPSNVTSLIQPLDQGIVDTIKRSYKMKLLTFLINAQADGINYYQAINSFTIKNAIDLISAAWDEISETKISSCWKNLLNVQVNENNNSDCITSEHIHRMCQKIRNMEDVTLDDINEWIHTDCLPSLTDEEIIEAIENPESDDTDAEADQLMENEISPAKALEGLDCAISFFEEAGEISLVDMKVLKSVRSRLLRIKNQI